ncbi:hypothetical protein [Cycloclasticus pugetii]|uniref:hypothetical protein n=1 Tax=Cycloclasticus pugetii TaxID=34068 RepID=UPI003A92ED2F
MNKPQDISATTNKSDTTALNRKQIIKTSSCKALSGNGEIGYEFSLDNKKSLHIRITSNSGGGFFSDESIPISDIEHILFSQTDPSRLTSVAFQPLFKGKSVNTPAFLMTALRNEGFVKPIGELKRFHQCVDAKSFKTLIKKLQKLAMSSTAGQ